jgi:hypothetical protein
MKFVFSRHAIEQMERRSIEKSLVERVLLSPDQILQEGGRMVYQGLTQDKLRLIRIFVNPEAQPQRIITVYSTSKIRKYYEGKV